MLKINEVQVTSRELGVGPGRMTTIWGGEGKSNEDWEGFYEGVDSLQLSVSYFDEGCLRMQAEMHM